MDNNNDFDGGESVPLGFGNNLVFYPIAWGDQRTKLGKQWAAVFGKGEPAASEAWMDAVVEIFYYSVNRPTMSQSEDVRISRATIYNMLDHRNLKACFRALGIASGWKKDTDPEQPTKGEKPSLDPTSPPSGGASTPVSSLPSIGTSSSATNLPGLATTS
jgi:hypothetical protein